MIIFIDIFCLLMQKQKVAFCVIFLFFSYIFLKFDRNHLKNFRICVLFYREIFLIILFNFL